MAIPEGPFQEITEARAREIVRVGGTVWGEWFCPECGSSFWDPVSELAAFLPNKPCHRGHKSLAAVQRWIVREIRTY